METTQFMKDAALLVRLLSVEQLRLKGEKKHIEGQRQYIKRL